MEVLSYNQDQTIRVKNKRNELTLAQYIKWQQEEENIQAIEHKIEELELSVMSEEIEESDAEIYEAEYNLDKYDCVRRQVELIIDQKEIPKLQKLTRLSLYELKLAATMEPYTDYEKNTTIIIPGANDQQIKDLEDYLKTEVPVEAKEERARIKLRINRLKKSEFILMPVQDAIFATKARTDAIRKQLPKLPEEVQKAQNAELNEEVRKNIALWIDKLDKELSAKDLDRTQDEVKERLKLKRLIKQWQAETETSVYQLADQFLTHLLIPVDEPYSSKYAEARRKYILEMTMDKVLPFINFILAVLKL